MALLEGMTAREIRDFIRARLDPREADRFDALVENVSHEVLLLVSARALTRTNGGGRISNAAAHRPEARGPAVRRGSP
jgi:hypothetical protein